MLTVRKRGRLYHVRGSIRVGTETRVIKEHSTVIAERMQKPIEPASSTKPGANSFTVVPGGRKA